MSIAATARHIQIRIPIRDVLCRTLHGPQDRRQSGETGEPRRPARRAGVSSWASASAQHDTASCSIALAFAPSPSPDGTPHVRSTPDLYIRHTQHTHTHTRKCDHTTAAATVTRRTHAPPPTSCAQIVDGQYIRAPSISSHNTPDPNRIVRASHAAATRTAVGPARPATSFAEMAARRGSSTPPPALAQPPQTSSRANELTRRRGRAPT